MLKCYAAWGRAALVGRLAGTFTFARGLLLLAGLAAATPAVGQGTVVSGPAGSVSFGSKVLVLPNGNFVVADPGFNSNRGAVYLYRGTDGRGLGILTGASAGDQVGSGGLLVLANGNFVVSSPEFGGSNIANNGLGAVTWVSGSNGPSGTVSASNSLVGSTNGDRVGRLPTGEAGVMALPNGNYLVRSPNWQRTSLVGAGAVTWGNGTAGVKGTISATNSLVGQYANDAVGLDTQDTPGVVVLANSSYVVVVPGYRFSANPAPQSYGAVAWGSGTAGVRGILDDTNALVGSTNGDQVGDKGIAVLPSGNYLVSSSSYANGNAARAGAVTWGSGTAGVKGTISASNSLVGTRLNDRVGEDGTVLVLANGNYVVTTPFWSASSFLTGLGAVTWGSGTAGVKGTISASNSLVGSSVDDNVGFDPGASSGIRAIRVFPLPNGNYVVFSPNWDKRTAPAAGDAGALTLGDGNGNTVGPVTACNSIVGSVANQGGTLSFSYNPAANNLLGGLPAENKVVVGVGAPAAPTGASTQPYTAGATVADLRPTGSTVNWYASAGGGSPLASTTPLTNGSTYYASQIVGSCESLSRLAVLVTAPLPVELTTFTATLTRPAAVRLAWTTASEKNSASFDVERSPDGTRFERIGTVAAAGSSTSPRSYELLDEQLPASATILYYRLRQVDQDGTASYSPVRTVTRTPTTGLALHPNPVASRAATLTGAQPGTSVTVYDALGRPVTSATTDAAGAAALALPVGRAAGVYVVRVGSQVLRLTVE